MDIVNFEQLGGFPLETETLKAMQDAYSLFNSLGDMIGDKSIIKGCTLIGNTVSAGVIYINGELMPFKGGQLQSNVIIVETVIDGQFENGEIKPIYKTRYATFGSGLNSIPWADLKRAYPLTSALFVGELRDYVGLIENIPFGWHLADGTNGTVNTQHLFPTQYIPNDPDYGVIGAEVGSNELVLTKENMPNYNLSGDATLEPHKHSLPKTVYSKEGGSGDDNTFSNKDNTGKVDVTETSMSDELQVNVSLSSGGSDEPIDIRPKRIVVAKIQFTGQ